MAKAKSKATETVDILSLPLQERVDMLAKIINDGQQQCGVGIVLTMKYGKLRIEPEMMFSDLTKKDNGEPTESSQAENVIQA